MGPLDYMENDRASQSTASHEQQRPSEIEILKAMLSTLTRALEALEHSNKSEDLGPGTNFYEEVARFEIDLIERALKQAGGNQAKAARLLGLNQTTLHGKIKHYGIHPVDMKYEAEHEIDENDSRRAAAATYSAFQSDKSDSET
jgi:transcriptional regulator with GAF, ATPase, and Fis domain